MKISFSPYVLKSSSGERHGALIRVKQESSFGYADCHPWPELGDFPLSVQLQLMQKGKVTALTQQTLKFARMDADARAKGINFFQNSKIPSSHKLLLQKNTNQDLSEFQRVKIKIGKDPRRDAETVKQVLGTLNETIKVRIDINAFYSSEQCLLFLDIIQPYLHRMDFIEDPCPYNYDIWRRIQEKYNVILASDREGVSGDLTFAKVLKPAIQDKDRFDILPCRLIITSYLDHPIGQLSAAYTASLLYDRFPEKIDVCGLLTHENYLLNAYSERLARKGDILLPSTQGTGWGYDDLLEKEKWYNLEDISIGKIAAQKFL
ncbi:MAG: hypothetical protein Tsb0021_05070 [Chlamydiales bacterium]